MAPDSGVVGIGAAHDVACLGRPQKPGTAGPTNTCTTPATHVLVCNAMGRTEKAPSGEVITLVLGMCDFHRPAIEFWAFRHYGQLGDGIVVPVDDVQELMRELLGDPDAPEVVSPLTGWAPVAATG